jgi:hypothetical protein
LPDALFAVRIEANMRQLQPADGDLDDFAVLRRDNILLPDNLAQAA